MPDFMPSCGTRSDQVQRIEKFSELESQLDEEQKEKVELLNSTILEKEKSQWRSGIIGLLVASILIQKSVIVGH